MIYRKSPEELGLMREGGRILGGALDALQDMIVPGVTTKELDARFEAIALEAGGTPSFKGYRGFPASICASPNEVIVHGIPVSTPLDEGDIVTIDVGLFYKGFHTDTAWTFPVGRVGPEVAKLLEVTEASLEAAIEQCHPGNRVGDIGYAVEQVVTPAGFSLVQEYAGHGVGRSLHEEPWVPNYGPPGRREKLVEGMTLAIEPMVNLGGAATKTLEDDWTVVTRDGSLSAHFEHTVAITSEGPEVLTLRSRVRSAA
ncbi:MAG TPA: type I methionyl aminopeptidase [Actinomycetota bacterium]|nr:type I methionyl aminopeptidase [Actinomycetota bacterium]